MNKRTLSAPAYGQRVFTYLHNIVGHYFPARFVLLTPDDWWRIPLPDPSPRRRSVKALAKRQFRGLDDQPTLRTRLERAMIGG